ncbi:MULTISPECIES: biotin synthase BioB [unclassified Porphyromonas]|uniref:biotin synthase BioB n=1 Tax=unclassified Porphyromonas TaxID=2645799 RepID=UPI00052BAFBF|nr:MULTISPECIES: biotin synthase BioB [unclassified Porphyromonas]KGN86096.1 biotin synthase [Porphyromonas sp. COT-290 OH860]KGO00818.1 biotin synthase [Porphyromonas sp. COT-290 OH3588]
MISEIKERILSGGAISQDEALALLTTPNKEELYEAAHEVTRHFMGNAFDTCSIINAKSGNCPEDCKWCAQSGHYATSAERYSLVSPSVCVAQATYNHKQGIGRFSLVASGRRQTDKEIDMISISYRAIKKANPTLKCCASLGLLYEHQLKKLFDSGVTTYHCNMETAPSYFAELCTTHSQKDKEETLAAARRVGMRICSGGIIGMGESAEQRVELAFYLKSIDAMSIPVNILQPITGTPLAEATPLSEEEILTAIAIFRLVNPRAFLRFSGGRAQLSPEMQRRAIYIGINSAITGDLLTTIGQQAKDDMAMIEECGLENRTVDWEVSYDY